MICAKFVKIDLVIFLEKTSIQTFYNDDNNDNNDDDSRELSDKVI